MRAYTAQMIEMLSLRQVPSGYQIEIGVTRSDGYAQQAMEIDEYTYNHLYALRPFDRERVRLSPYHKWDPFRKTHYSTVIRMSEGFMETLYFPCSEHYLQQLLQLRQAECVQPAGNTLEHAVDQAVKPIKRARHPAHHYVALILFMFLFFMNMDEKLFTGKTEALSPHVNAAASSGSVSLDVLKTGSNEAQDIQGPYEPEGKLQPEPEPAELTPQPEYVVIDVERGKSMYGLPEGYVALSFDDGPSKYTEKIVDILKEQKIAATFLFIGKNALHYPDAVAYANKHSMSIGNHSWDHSNLARLNPTAQKENIAKANTLLESLIDSPVTLFRPPYGAFNQELAASVKDQQMKVLLWNRDPEDWNAKASDDILQYMYSVNPSGGLYVLHEDELTVAALPEIIRYFKEKQLKFAAFQ